MTANLAWLDPKRHSLELGEHDSLELGITKPSSEHKHQRHSCAYQEPSPCLISRTGMYAAFLHSSQMSLPLKPSSASAIRSSGRKPPCFGSSLQRKSNASEELRPEGFGSKPMLAVAESRADIQDKELHVWHLPCICNRAHQGRKEPHLFSNNKRSMHPGRASSSFLMITRRMPSRSDAPGIPTCSLSPTAGVR